MNARDVIASVHTAVFAGHTRRVEPWRGYFAASLFCAAIVIAGFAPSYYLKEFTDSPPLSPMLQLHGLVMTAWFALFIAQTWLVAAHRVDWHRRLGVIGAVLAVLVVVTGVAVGIEGARLGHTVPGRVEPAKFLIVPMGTAVMFGALIGAALALRRRREMHRRLMLLATLAILTPPLARLLRLALGSAVFAGVPVILIAFALNDLVIAAFVAADVIETRRFHPAFVWGFGFVIATQVLRMPLAATPQWQQFATWLIQ